MPATLNPDELGSLMDAVESAGQAHQSEPLGPEAVPHDLTNPERNVPEPMPALEAAHERLASQLARAIAGRTRQRFVIRPGRVTKCRFEELDDLMMPPTVLAVIDLVGTGRQGLLLLDRPLAEALLGAGLGLASSDDGVIAGDTDDSFTSLERAVLRRILSLVEAPLKKAYAPMTRLSPRVRCIQPDQRLARILEPGEVALSAAFTAEGELAGRLRLVLPFAVLESAKRELIQLRHDDAPARSPRTHRAVQRALSSVRVSVQVDFGAKRMPMAHVRDLKPGDLITLNTDENTALAVRVNGMTKMLAHPTVCDGALAASVMQMAPASSHLRRGGLPEGELRLATAHPRVGTGLEHSQGKEGTMNDLGESPNAAPASAHAADHATPINLDDVLVNVTVRLGQTSMSIGEVMAIAEGSVIKLDKAAGEPLDILVNGRLIGRGEAVVVGERFGVRLTDVNDQPLKGAA